MSDFTQLALADEKRLDNGIGRSTGLLVAGFQHEYDSDYMKT
jgi:hypothetical protein